MKKIFVTGATGYIGHQLTRKLVESGHTVNVLIRHQNDAALFTNPHINVFYGDITASETIREAIKGCEQVYHTAGYAKLWAKDPSVFYEINVNGTKNVLQEALNAGVRKLVYTSSAAVFGPSFNSLICEKDPRMISFRSDYDLSKQLAEYQVKEYAQKGLFSVIVNPTRVYGPGLLSHSNAFCRMLLDGMKGKFVFIPGGKSVISNYAFIDDVVEGHIKAMQWGISGERYILGGENIAYEEVLRILKNEVKRIRLIPLSLNAMQLLGYFELVRNKISGLEPLITPAAAKRFFLDATFSNDKAIRQLCYSITPFNVGLKQTIDYVNTIHHEK